MDQIIANTTKTLLATAAQMGALSGTAASTYLVCAAPCQYTTIQSAINAAILDGHADANNPATVLVYPKTGAACYVEDLTLAPGISLTGMIAENTCIDGEMTFAPAVSPADIAVQNFVLRAGNGKSILNYVSGVGATVVLRQISFIKYDDLTPAVRYNNSFASMILDLSVVRPLTLAPWLELNGGIVFVRDAFGINTGPVIVGAGTGVAIFNNSIFSGGATPYMVDSGLQIISFSGGSMSTQFDGDIFRLQPTNAFLFISNFGMQTNTGAPGTGYAILGTAANSVSYGNIAMTGTSNISNTITILPSATSFTPVP